MLTDLACTYVKSINEGSVPRIESAWVNVLESSCQKAMKEAVIRFEKRIQEEIKLPTEESILKKKLTELARNSVDEFKDECISKGADIKKYVNQIDSYLSEFIEDVMKKNRGKILGSVDSYLSQEYTEVIEKNLKRGQLYQSFSEYSEAVEEMIESFKKYF
jgi:hypothetical protein